MLRPALTRLGVATAADATPMGRVLGPLATLGTTQTRTKAYRYLDIPKPGVHNQQFRYRVDLPPEYTVSPLRIRKLAGRDPYTGRVVVGTLGGCGMKQRYRWVDPVMRALEDGSPREERVVNICYDPLRSCMIACVGRADKLRFIIAHKEMKIGDLVTTYGDIPRMPVRPKIGDAHPLGALPVGTEIYNIEVYLGEEHRMCINGGTYATVLRKVDKKVIIQMPSKRQFSFNQQCMCIVGRVQERIPAIWPIGSAQRLRHLGYHPRSGLFQKKTGRFGRKIRRLPPLREYEAPPAPRPEPLEVHIKDRMVPCETIGRLMVPATETIDLKRIKGEDIH